MGGRISSQTSLFYHGKAKSLLHDAIRGCDGLFLTEILLGSKKSRPDPNVYDKFGMMPLHLASEMGDVQLVAMLLLLGAEVNFATEFTQGSTTPLIIAASNGRAECVRLLLEMGASVNAVDDWGNTALFKAASYNHIDCVKHLLAYKADPDIANRWGALPIQYAALQGHYKVLELLVNGDADLTLRGEDGVPPALAAAAMKGYHKCVELLLKSGADVDSPCSPQVGENPLHLTIKYFQHACCGYDCNSTASLAARLQAIKLLLNGGATISRACVQQLYSKDVDICFTAQYLDFLKLFIRAVPGTFCESKHSPILDILEDIAPTQGDKYEQDSVLQQKKLELINLMRSVGVDTQTDSDYKDNEGLQCQEFTNRNPQSLSDLCRLSIRSNVHRNVIYTSQRLPLPTLLKDYLILKTKPL